MMKSGERNTFIGIKQGDGQKKSIVFYDEDIKEQPDKSF